MQITSGYRPGIIGEITELHAKYYAQHHGFGARFESKVASGLADFVGRLDSTLSEIWVIIEQNQIAGSIAIGGEDLGNGNAHLRWFIIADALRGKGSGKELLQVALDFCDLNNFSACDLWTFKSLNAARHLYESFGFVLEEQWEGNQWGTPVAEQRFRRFLPK